MPGPEGSPDGGFSTMMLMFMGWIVVATALFFFRPARLRQRPEGKPAHGSDNVRVILKYV